MNEYEPRINPGCFTNCLRTTVAPDELQDERIEAVKSHCLTCGFENVILFIANEEFFTGHLTREEAVPWIETIKKAKRILNASGISVSLNPWHELGHVDRGRTLKPGQNFVTMRDFNGLTCGVVACPLDKNWREYYFDILQYYAREVRPDFYWIEDDFRLHNHDANLPGEPERHLEFGGCFCEHHIKLFNSHLGTDYTRGELVKKIFAPGPLSRERQAWLDVSRETMRELAAEIGRRIVEASPDTKPALMSSAPAWHCMEARDWEGLHRGLAAGGPVINRIHLPLYEETVAAKHYYYHFNAVSMAIRRFIPEDALIYPELENNSYSTYSKDRRFLRFQLESAIPLGLNGMTYDIYDFCGNGPVESFGYGAEIAKARPYLQAVQNLGLRQADLTGVVVPIDEKAVYHNSVNTGWQDLMPDEFNTAGYLSAMGVNYRYSLEKHFSGSIVALFNSGVNNFTDDELRDLFADNFVFIDGGAALKLVKRGLGTLASIKSAVFSPANSGLQSYEQAEEGVVVGGIRGRRASAQKQAGDWVNISYGGGVTVLSRLYTHWRKPAGPGFVIAEKFAVLPFVYNQKLMEQFNDLRRDFVYRALAGAAKNRGPVVFTNYPAVSPYLYKKADGYVLVLVNSTVTGFPELSFSVEDLAFERIDMISRTGTIRPVSFTRKEGTISIDENFEHLSTKTLLLR
jgi:hypothetical protein